MNDKELKKLWRWFDDQPEGTTLQKVNKKSIRLEHPNGNLVAVYLSTSGKFHFGQKKIVVEEIPLAKPEKVKKMGKTQKSRIQINALAHLMRYKEFYQSAWNYLNFNLDKNLKTDEFRGASIKVQWEDDHYTACIQVCQRNVVASRKKWIRLINILDADVFSSLEYKGKIYWIIDLGKFENIYETSSTINNVFTAIYDNLDEK